MIGTPRVHHRLTDSTNERAKQLAAAGAPHGTLITAGAQTAGRGRQGRLWVAPPGSAVLMSLITREPRPTLPLAGAVAVCEAMPVRCEIKWPNDVWVDGRKLAGILVEGRPQEGWAVLGLGLNVTSSEFPPELREIATSLRLAGAEVRPEQVLQRLLETLDAWLAGPDRAVLAAWSERDALRGRPVSWEGGHGIAAGIDDTGSLLVDTPDGRLVLAAGEVHLNRPDRETRGESPHRPPRAPRR